MYRAAAGLAGLAPVLVLAACSSGGGPTGAEGRERVACALGAGAQFAEVCALERAFVHGANVLVVRHPDGGFRRFVADQDGGGLVTADGAAAAQVARNAGMIEVRVDDDRYRLALTEPRHAGS